MQFSVPKSIDMPDKVVGPFTIKQFIFMAGAAGTIYFFFQLIPNTIVALLVATPIAAIGFSLAFVKINGQSFLKIFQSVIIFFKHSRFYIWYHDSSNNLTKKEDTQKKEAIVPEKNNKNNNKIQDIAWALDVYDRKD